MAAYPSCDRAIAGSTAPPAEARPDHARWILTTTILASSLAFIDGSVVNVALPAIGRSLDESGGALAWVVNAYLLPLSALLMIGGAAGDLYGKRRLLVVGTAFFALASLGCALAPNMAWLFAGRVLQGIGAALLLPNSLAILGATFGGEARGRAIGIWAAVGAAAGAAGPVVGGILIDTFGWRAIFLINLPLALGAIVLALRYVPNERDAGHGPLDFAGGALATLGLAALTWGLTVLSASDRASPATMIAVGAGVACLVLFVVVEHRLGDRAMVRTALFGSSNFIGLTLLTLLLYGALSAMLVLVPYVLIESGNYSATEAGAALLPLPLVIALGSSTMGGLAARIGPRLPLTVGPMIAAIGCAMTIRITGDGSYWTTAFPALLVMSLGMAIAVAPLTTAVLSSVDQQHTGVASGFNSAIARVGGLIATALLGGALAAHGVALAVPFRAAALAAAAAALAAGACAYAWVRRKQESGNGGVA